MQKLRELNEIDAKKLHCIATQYVKLNGCFSKAAIYNSNCECGDNDGCDGDCGGDCTDASCPSGN